ncbi:MAG: hypothetical protein JO034_05635, partial [Singulisphaera sp.]|nr:hypothetical protein [Singulisphaera sp.]
EAVVPWEVFTRSVTEAEKLAQPEDFDYLHRIGDGYPMFGVTCRNSLWGKGRIFD